MSDAVHALDLPFLGSTQVLACGVLDVGDGVALVDPGPTTVLPALEAGLADLGFGLQDVRAVLLTHIHLDHAGASGTIARRVPDARIYVHSLGARHLAHPERLIASATRLYGDRMDELWGAFEAVPESQIQALDGGEAITVNGRMLDVAYTPGHAIHHVSYYDRSSRTAFVGDTVGMACPPSGRVEPVAPPPDVDLERWPSSLDAISAWSPERLFRMHWGPSETPVADIAAFRERLEAWSARVRADLAQGGNQRMHAEAFSTDVLTELEDEIGAEAAAPYRAFLYPDASWQGLARAWERT